MSQRRSHLTFKLRQRCFNYVWIDAFRFDTVKVPYASNIPRNRLKALFFLEVNYRNL